MTTERAESRKTCVWHCSTCNRHFASIGAFDGHRQDGECVDPREAVSQRGRQLLQLWTADGYCSLEKGCRAEGRIVKTLHPVEIWQGAVKQDDAQASLFEEGRALAGVKS